MSKKNNQLARTLSVREACIEKLPIFYGSRDNYTHGFKEVMANGIDEMCEHFESGVMNVYLKDNNTRAVIEDTGRGIPLFIKDDKGVENYILLFKTLFSGTKYDGGGNETGCNGVGTCTLNHTSVVFEVTSYHDGKVERVYFENGGELKLKDSKPYTAELGRHGTTVEFKLDKTVYPTDTYDLSEIKAIVKAYAGVSGNIKYNFYLEDELVETYQFKELKDYYDDITTDNTCKPINSTMATYILPIKFGKDKDKEEYVKVEGFISTSVSPVQMTYLNRTYLSEGGRIVDGVCDGVIEVCNEYATKNKLFPKGIKEFTKKDVLSGCSFLMNVLSNNVEFANQTKLSTKKNEYRKRTKEYVKVLLLTEITENETNFKKFIKHLLTINKMNDNNDKARAKINKELRKNVSGMGKRPDKLTDCNAKYIGAGKGGEFYICEGDSAKGTAVDARDPRLFQAIYPIRGKILNVLKASLKDAINNEIIKQIFQIIGTGIGEDFDINTRRYDKIVITADQDNDGFQIRQLVISVLWKFTPQLILNGHVYIAETPLYEIKVKGEKSIYVYSESEKDRVIEELNKPYKLSRAKGLGELDAEVMHECAMCPETRQLIQVTVEDVKKFNEALELWMGEEVAPRREYILDNLKKYLDGEITLEDKNNAVQLINHDYMEYSGYTINDRAIVNLTDGLKPSYQRILWTMYKRKYFDLVKCANIEGGVMEYHPHGSAYPTMITLIQKDGNNIPLIDGKGSFGRHTSREMKASAPRYTECKLSELVRYMLKDLDQVEMIPNYDGTKTIPREYPVNFPSVLCIGTQGMAVGLASNIPSFNLKEVCENTIAYLKGEEMKLLYPDFPTKGYILKGEGVTDCSHTGKGKFTVRGNIYQKDRTTLVIDEIPYNTVLEDVISGIEALANKGVDDIKDVINATSLEGMAIEITIKPSANAEYIMELIKTNTQLTKSYTSNIGVLWNNKPIYIGTNEVIAKWCEWKRGCIRKATAIKIKKVAEQGHLMSSFEKISLDLDKAIEIIRFKEIKDLMDYFKLDEAQAEWVYKLPLRKINDKEVIKMKQEVIELRKEYKRLKAILEEDGAVDVEIIKGLEETIKLFGIDRNTRIVEFDTKKVEIEVKPADIPTYSITITEQGYVYKTTIRNKENITLKPDDKIVYQADNIKDNNEILAFNGTDCHKIVLDTISVTNNGSLGHYINLPMGTRYCLLREETENLLYIYEEGRVALVKADGFRTTTRRSKLSNKVCEGLTLLNVIDITTETSVTIKCKGFKKTIELSTLTPKTSANTQGIRVTKRKIENYNL